MDSRKWKEARFFLMGIPEQSRYWQNCDPYIDAQRHVLRDLGDYASQFRDDHLSFLAWHAVKENVSFPLLVDPEKEEVIIGPMVEGYVRLFRKSPPEGEARKCRIFWDAALIDTLAPQSREVVINASFSGAMESLRVEYQRAVGGESDEVPEEIYRCMELLERRYEDLCAGRHNVEVEKL